MPNTNKETERIRAYAALWKECWAQRGELPADSFQDVVMALLFLRCASERRTGAIKVPEGCAFDDLVTLAATRASAMTLSKRILSPALAANGIDPLPGFSTLGQWPRRSLKTLISLFANADLKWGDKRQGSQMFDVFRALSQDPERKQLGHHYIPNEITAAIASEIIKTRSADKALELYDPFCSEGRLLSGLAAAWDQPRRLRIFGHTRFADEKPYVTMNLLLKGCRNMRIEHADPIASPFTSDRGSPVDLCGTPALRRFDVVASDLSGKIPPFKSDLADDLWNRFGQSACRGKCSGYWTAIEHIVASLESGGCGACILNHSVLHAGKVDSGFLAGLHKSGALEMTVELPAFGQSEKPRYLLVLRSTSRKRGT